MECIPAPLPDIPITLESFLQSPFNPSVDLYKIAGQILGDAWYTGATKKIGHNFFMLEAHRKLILTEHISGVCIQDRTKVLTRSYVIIDPITLVIPILMDSTNENARLTSAIEDIKILARSYKEIGKEDNIVFPGKGDIYSISLNTVNHRIQKENKAMQAWNTSPWVIAYKTLVDKFIKLLQEDTYAISATRILPPTKSLPDAVYDISSLL